MHAGNGRSAGMQGGDSEANDAGGAGDAGDARDAGDADDADDATDAGDAEDALYLRTLCSNVEHRGMRGCVDVGAVEQPVANLQHPQHVAIASDA